MEYLSSRTEPSPAVDVPCSPLAEQPQQTISATPAKRLTQLPQVRRSMSTLLCALFEIPCFFASSQDCTELICRELGSDLGRFACVSKRTNDATGPSFVWRETYQVLCGAKVCV